MPAGRKKNPINDIVDTVGAWLGGNRGTVNPQVARVQRDLGRAVSAADAATGGLGAAALRDVKNFQQGGSLPTNLAKTAAVNLAAGAVGAKAAQVAGRAVAKTGIPARVANKVTGKTVIVHSSPIKGLKTIEPRVAPAAPEAGARVFGARPSNRAPAYDYESMVRIGRHYVSERSAQAQSALGKTVTGYEGSMYVAKVPTKTLEGANAYVRSPVPAKVVKEIPISGPMPYRSAVDAEDVRKLERAFRRAGGRPLKAPKEPKISKTSKSSRPRS